MKTYLVRGVPRSLQLDAFWMSSETEPEAGANAGGTGVAQSEHPGPFLVLLVLVFLGDVLLWQVNPGASIAVFVWAVVGSVWALSARGWSRNCDGAALLVALASTLPVIEEVQLLSVAFCVLGASSAVVLLTGVKGLASLRRFWAIVPLRGIRDLIGAIRVSSGPQNVQSRLRHSAALWAVPIGLGLVFAALLIDANPMLEDWVSEIPQTLWPQIDVGRLMFWVGLAMLIWPCLVFAQGPAPAGRFGPAQPWRVPGVINAGSVVRSLALFNALFAVQTILDVAYLWSGAQLPDGLSYAEYAHRGAYPLLVTALLAGLFAVVSRPFTQGNSLLRMALMMWVAQTVLLVVSSLYRLDLYVGTYGLTRLRLAAAFWMVCVALGLSLVQWQVWQNRTASWLLVRSAVLGLGVLYATCFISFDATIAQYNLGHNVPLDRWYLCNLGDAARPAMLRFEHATGSSLCDQYGTSQLQAPVDWREWGFRGWRVRRSLAALEQTRAAFR